MNCVYAPPINWADAVASAKIMRQAGHDPGFWRQIHCALAAIPTCLPLTTPLAGRFEKGGYLEADHCSHQAIQA
jgi:hypothetical protein